MGKRMLIINSKDNVGVVLEAVNTGGSCQGNGREVVALDNIEFAHKVALVDIAAGTDIIKYGEKIGFAKVDIQAGQWVHVHNLDCERGHQRRVSA